MLICAHSRGFGERGFVGYWGVSRFMHSEGQAGRRNEHGGAPRTDKNVLRHNEKYKVSGACIASIEAVRRGHDGRVFSDEARTEVTVVSERRPRTHFKTLLRVTRAQAT